MLAKLGIGCLAVTMGAGVSGGIVAQQYGIAMVHVEEKSSDGISLTIPVPLVLVEVAMAFVPAEERLRIKEELTEALPLAQAALAELANIQDDATLVEVETPDETVYVGLKSGDLLVDVNSRDEYVRVEVPVRGVRNVLQALAE